MVDYSRYLVRLNKRDVWKRTFLVESYEGVASYTTTSFKKHELGRTVELIVPKGWTDVADEFLKELKSEISPFEIKVIEHSRESNYS